MKKIHEDSTEQFIDLPELEVPARQHLITLCLLIAPVLISILVLLDCQYNFASPKNSSLGLISAKANTALGLLALSIAGLLLIRAKKSFLSVMMRPTLAGRMGRRLLASAILVPPLLNWLQLQGVKLNIWNPNFGVLIPIIGNVLFFSWTAFQTTAKLTQAEEARALALKREFAQSHQRQVTQARLDLITNSIPAFISYVDSNQRYLFANSAYETLFGFRPEEVVGKTTQEILGLAYPNAEPFMLKALAGQTVRYQNQIVDQKKASRFFEVDCVPDISAHGEVKGFVIIGHDVTERIKLEQNLASAVKAGDEPLSISPLFSI